MKKFQTSQFNFYFFFSPSMEGDWFEISKIAK